jgi:hypothetical protein
MADLTTEDITAGETKLENAKGERLVMGLCCGMYQLSRVGIFDSPGKELLTLAEINMYRMTVVVE